PGSPAPNPTDAGGLTSGRRPSSTRHPRSTSPASPAPNPASTSDLTSTRRPSSTRHPGNTSPGSPLPDLAGGLRNARCPGNVGGVGEPDRGLDSADHPLGDYRRLVVVDRLGDLGRRPAGQLGQRVGQRPGGRPASLPVDLQRPEQHRVGP